MSDDPRYVDMHMTLMQPQPYPVMPLYPIEPLQQAAENMAIHEQENEANASELQQFKFYVLNNMPKLEGPADWNRWYHAFEAGLMFLGIRNVEEIDDYGPRTQDTIRVCLQLQACEEIKDYISDMSSPDEILDRMRLLIAPREGDLSMDAADKLVTMRWHRDENIYLFECRFDRVFRELQRNFGDFGTKFKTACFLNAVRYHLPELNLELMRMWHEEWSEIEDQQGKPSAYDCAKLYVFGSV